MDPDGRAVGARHAGAGAEQQTPHTLTDVLDHPHVRLLFTLAQVSDVNEQRFGISVKNAPAIIALMALAVEWRTLPPEYTKDFYTECASFYTSLMERLTTIAFLARVDVEGFVASLVACGLKFRGCAVECNVGSGGSSENLGKRSGGLIDFAAFDERIIDKIIVSCIPEAIDDCVGNPIAFGALEGLSLSVSKEFVTGSQLANHLQNLMDAFTVSPKRKTLQYKQLLCHLMEAICCARDTDYRRVHNWFHAVLQPEYILNGLLQKTSLHSRVAAATLTVLTRWMQDAVGAHMRNTKHNRNAIAEKIFTALKEGEELIERIWEALLHASDTWEESCKTDITLYGDNVRLVVDFLLRAEIERIKCHRTLSSLRSSDFLVTSTPNSGDEKEQQQQEQQQQKQQQEEEQQKIISATSEWNHMILVAEEDLRLRVIGNIVKFLVLPMSLFNVIPETPKMTLRHDIAEQCAKIIVFTASGEDDINALDPKDLPSKTMNANRAPARFSNSYYSGLEIIARELILRLLKSCEGDSPVTTEPSKDFGESALISLNKDAVSRTAALCLQSLCEVDSHVQSFSLTMIMDFMARLSMEPKRDAELSARQLTVGYDALCRLLFSQQRGLLKPLPHGDIMRFAQMLFDTFEDALRRFVLKGDFSKATSAQFPCKTMIVVCNAFSNLVQRWHTRIKLMIHEGLRASTGSEAEKEKLCYVEVINEDYAVLQQLLRDVLRCMTNAVCPGSGILYASEKEKKISKGESTRPSYDMSKTALKVLSPFLDTLCGLFQMSTLFPVKDLHALVDSCEDDRNLSKLEASNNYAHLYYLKLFTTKSPFYAENGMALFRTFWLILSYYGFTNEALLLTGTSNTAGAFKRHNTELLTEQEATHIRLLAASAPPLMRMRSSDFQQTMADIAVLECSLADGVSARQKELIDAIQQVGTAVSRVSFSEAFLVNALLTLEMLRASCGSIHALTQYQHFEVREFDARDEIRTILQHVTEIVTTQYICAIEEMPPNVAAAHVNEDARALVLQYGFAIASVRESARLILSKLIHAFPSFATSSSALPLLWTIIDLLNGNAADVECFCERVRFPWTPAIATDPNSLERRKQLQRAVDFAQYWATEARGGFSFILLEHATQFVAETETSPGGVGASLGLQLAMGAQSDSGTSLTSTLDLTYERKMYQPFAAESIIKRSNAKVQAMAVTRLTPQGTSVEQLLLKQLQLMTQEEFDTVDTAMQRRERRFATLETSVRATTTRRDVVETSEEHCPRVAPDNDSHRVKNKDSQRITAADSLMCTVAAFLCLSHNSASAHVEILRVLVKGPIRLFSCQHIAAAVSGWKWILTERMEHYAVPLLVQVIEGFQWTIAQRIGLFDGSTHSQSDEVETENKTAPIQSASNYSAGYSTISPHKLLIDFLSLCYVDESRPISFHPTVLLLLYRLVVRIVESPSQISTKDASFYETISYALMVSRICRNLHSVNNRRLRNGCEALVSFSSIGRIRQALYQCLLRWFRKTPPSWYFAQEPAVAREAVEALQHLMAVFDAEEEKLSHSPSGFLDFELSNHSDTSYTLLGSNVRRRVREATKNFSANLKEAVQQAVVSEQNRLRRLIGLLRLLTDHERVRLLVWLQPQDLPPSSSFMGNAFSEADWRMYCQAADQNDPAVLLALVSRFPNAHVLRIATQLVSEKPEAYCHVQGAVDLYLNETVLNAGYPHLYLFSNCSIIQALRFLDERYTTHYPQLSTYAIRSLLSQKSEDLVFYLPQLLQVVAADETGEIKEFLKKMCDRSGMFTHQLLWALQTEAAGSGKCAKKYFQLAWEVQQGFHGAQRTFYEGEFAYIQKIVSLSGEMKLEEKAKRKDKLRLRLRDEEFHLPITRHHLYLPTDPKWRIVGVIPHTAGAVQSAAKCPILVQFHCAPREVDAIDAALTENQMKLKESEKTVVKACIFKMGDDCRQDQIALQLIGLFQRIFHAINVPSYLYPYKVVTTGKECGIIECIPCSMSRHQIGKLVESNIAEYFVQTYGHPESVTFHRARDCFIKSMAAYSVASFVLNIKDRHNGNLMIDASGHLLHIDFGFLFECSPGGDMNFESSPFKLTSEMLQLMGHPVGTGAGTIRSASLAKALVDPEAYNLFVDTTIRCYLAVHQYARQICILVELLIRSGLPCLKPHKTVQNLAHRLSMQSTELEAADFMLKRISQSKQNLRTVLYDRYQNFAEGIEM